MCKKTTTKTPSTTSSPHVSSATRVSGSDQVLRKCFTASFRLPAIVSIFVHPHKIPLWKDRLKPLWGGSFLNGQTHCRVLTVLTPRLNGSRERSVPEVQGRNVGQRQSKTAAWIVEETNWHLSVLGDSNFIQAMMFEYLVFEGSFKGPNLRTHPHWPSQ